MRSVLILGLSGFSQLMKTYIERFTEDKIVGFVCHREYIDKNELNGIPVYPVDMIKALYSQDEVFILPAIGYTKMGQLRAKLVDEMQRKGYQFYSFIHPTVSWYGDSMGVGNIILENVTFCLHAKLGNHNVIFNNCAFAHDTYIGDFNHFGACVAISGNTHVGNHCFLGTNSTLKNEINIADYTFIGASAYVSKTTHPYSVIVPARSSTLYDVNSLDVKI